MAEPDTVDSGDGTDEPSPDATPDSPEQGEAKDEDVEMVTDVAESGVDPDGFFDGKDVDPEGHGDDVGDIFDGVEDDGDGSETPEAASTRDIGLAADINNGASRLAVIGLDDEWETESGTVKSKDDLQAEFKETFEAFRLGHYGATVAEEYLLQDAEDIHPVWGLVGAMLICSAVIVYKRPDGDQLIESGKTKLGDADIPSLSDKLDTGDESENEEDSD